jgi:bifunctional N-acetylglucosamine-1-phosphate-uridyltransferase/glucosamine-1-phosphate-acetyltransferase GlmU-like protein
VQQLKGLQESSMERNLGAIILAAGKGKRMQSREINKVAMLLNDKPIIAHVLSVLENMDFKTIVVVIGFAKESVINAVKDSSVLFAEQEEQLGTGHAVVTALEKIPESVSDVLVIQGDDSYFYTEDLFSKLSKKHFATNAAMTFLTIQVENQIGLGRVVRDEYGNVVSVIEEKDADDKIKNITEINPACYIFSVSFLKKYLPKLQKSPVTGEYYLTSLIDTAIKNKERLETVQAGFIPWRGVNTPEELAEAERLFNQ